MQKEKSLLIKITLSLLIAICCYNFIYAQDNVTMADRIIAATFKSLAKTFTATTDINKLKENGIDKVRKMDDNKFRRRYVEVYEVLKYLPPELKAKYGITEDMNREQVIKNMESADKKSIYEMIDAIPDKVIADQFKHYLDKTRQKIQKSNLVEQVTSMWNKITEKIKKINKGDLVMAKTKEIELPQPQIKGKVSLEEAIAKRRSQRTFSKKDLSLEQIGQLLWAAQGITARRQGLGLRAAPSAGTLYPLEIYLVSKDGFFHYLPEVHRLEVLAERDLRDKLCSAALGQGSIAQAPVDMVICAVYGRVTAKYRERGLRYTHIEVGHTAQNIHLEAVVLGLNSVPIGAFNDKEVKKGLSLPDDCQPLYIIPVGYLD